ncbi:MAG TPA: efflux RND transporter periplasmic adaptor subunit [Vicinamibacterales bacterium]|nr:efflux RND transporter periplasmic adaptor subunit [Vicinamibacterales bacterium]
MRRWPLVVTLLIVVIATGCGGSSPSSSTAKPAAAAKVENPKPEGDLSIVTLSDEARKHLAIATAKVTTEPVRLTRTVGGELMVPPGRSVIVTAPVAGTLAPGRVTGVGPVKRGDAIFELVPLQQPERDVRAEAERVLGEAEARLTQTSQRLQRLEQLLKDGSTSVRAVEDARADRAAAAAAVEAARKRNESVGRAAVGARGELSLTAPFDGQIIAMRAAAGQVVAAGATVAEVAQTSDLWVRVPVFAGDLHDIDASQSVVAALLGQEVSGPWRDLRRVSGPPAANSSAASVDLYFQVSASNLGTSRPGERLSVQLPLKSTSKGLVVPRSAVVYDINGGTWVYEDRGQNHFARKRVELGGPAGQRVVIVRGLSEGMTIVTVGAAELYGTEFYVSK